MNARVVVDPVTRIEGHLRIEAQMNGNQIEQAYSSGTMVRGIEIILRDRDPRDAWAFAQRICGVCTLVHGIASIRSVENAVGAKVPPNAELIRNLMIGAQYIHDHVMHFYHLHALDWVDVVSALKADPAATAALAQSLSSYPRSSTGYFRDVQKKVADFVAAGQLGIFAKAYWGHPEYKLPPEANLMAVAHYLDALEWQRDVARLHAIFGGKNPHPNFVVGGVPCPIDLNSDSAINSKRLSQVQDIINKMKAFVEQVYVPDTIAIASFYKDWFARGEGLGNFMCFGDLPGTSMNDPDSFLFPRGIILDRDLTTVHELRLDDPAGIQEFVSHSWYDYSGGKEVGLHPWSGETNLNYSGPQPPYDHLDVEQSYSWLKSPRWQGKAMEVGPLARVLMLYVRGHEVTQHLVNSTLSKLELPPRALFSTLGRTAARTLETAILAESMQGWLDSLIANIKVGDTQDLRRFALGAGELAVQVRGRWRHGSAARCTLTLGCHRKRQDRQLPGDCPEHLERRTARPDGPTGAYEAALEDAHVMADPKQPLEILRTIHSFDPCIACAVHVTDPDGEELVQVAIR